MRIICFAALAALLSQPAAALELRSSDIKEGQPMPIAHNYPRCGGKNISPALSWSEVPKGAKSLVLTMIDTAVKQRPGGWSHWVVLDLPAKDGSFTHGHALLPPGAHALASDFGDTTYDGPCPPAGTGVHTYEFTIWALPGAKAETTDGSAKIGAWLERHAIAKARLTGTVTAR
jgi:Raf kinase inhibitor-like YbhB/YbcL family protein